MRSSGDECGLTYWTESCVVSGDVVRTSTGRRYLVTSARRSRGRDPHWVLRCVVMHPNDPDPDGAAIHPLVWFPRNPKKAL